MAAEKHRCAAKAANGAPCQAWALHGHRHCFRHSPEHAEEAAEASRLGGLRKRKEATVATIYEFEGFDEPEDVLRLLQVAVTDTLSLENSTKRTRTLVYAASVAIRVWETIHFDRRLHQLELAIGLRGKGAPDEG